MKSFFEENQSAIEEALLQTVAFTSAFIAVCSGIAILAIVVVAVIVRIDVLWWLLLALPMFFLALLSFEICEEIGGPF